VVEWRNNSFHFSYNRRNLHGSSNEHGRLSIGCKCRNSRNGKCTSVSTNNQRRWIIDFLCRWFGNVNLIYRNVLPLVEWRYNSFDFSNNSRNIFCSSNECFRLSIGSIFRNNGYGKCVAKSAYHISWWSNNVLFRWFGNLDFFGRFNLFMV
jgi:hypothetical protein